jgi:lipopolysaccharide transport system permease protein
LAVQSSPAIASADPIAARPVRRIQPTKGLVPLDLGELWRFRELLYYLLYRDVKARYRQTFLGAFWAIFRPLVQMVLLAAVFGGLAGIQSGSDVPYPLFLYTGLLGWTYFSSALSGSTSSLAGNIGLMSKAYFPRLYAPLAAVTAPLVDFFLALTIVFGLFAWFHRAPSWHTVFLPCFLVLAMMAGLGVGLWLAGATTRYRDIPFALPFLVQLWMYATPIIYPVSLVPGEWRWLLALNPMTAVIEGIRWSLLGVSTPQPGVLVVSVVFGAAVLSTGLFFFRRAERTIVDML